MRFSSLLHPRSLLFRAFPRSVVYHAQVFDFLIGWGGHFVASPLVPYGCFSVEKESRKRKAGVSVFTCTSLCAPVCCSFGKARAGTALSPRRCACNPTKPRMIPSVAMNICISIHSPPRLASAPREALENCELSAKNSPFSAESPPFSRVSSGEVGSGFHLGAKSRLATVENAGWKKLARRKKNSIFAEVCSACDISLRRPAVPTQRAVLQLAPAHGRRQRGHFCARRASLRRRHLSSHFLPQQQLFSC